MPTDAPRPTPRAGCASETWTCRACHKSGDAANRARAEKQHAIVSPDCNGLPEWSPVPPASAPAATAGEPLNISDEERARLPKLGVPDDTMVEGISAAPLRPEVQAELDAFREHLTWHREDSAPDCRFCTERDAKKRPAATPEPDDETSVICRDCGTLVGGVEAGSRVRWVVCEKCARPTGEEAETRYVAQEDSMGCGVACLAMVSGRTYAEVRAGLPESWLSKLDAVGNGAGLSEHGMRYWLNREGFFTRWTWMQGDAPRPVPTSGVAIMLTAGASADHPNHWVVLVDGRVLDPMRPTPLPVYDFLQAIEVLPSRLTAQATALAALRARVEPGPMCVCGKSLGAHYMDGLTYYCTNPHHWVEGEAPLKFLPAVPHSGPRTSRDTP